MTDPDRAPPPRGATKDGAEGATEGAGGGSGVTLRPLRRDDAEVVRGWLGDYLEQHRAWWRAAYGRAPTTRLQALVERDWLELLAGAAPLGEGGRRARWIRVAEGAAGGEAETGGAGEADPVPLGVVRADVYPDRYMGFPVGTLQWVYVDPAARGRGVGSALLAAANAWMERRDACGKQVFVTAENAPAVALYRRHGYRVIDHRMLAR